MWGQVSVGGVVLREEVSAGERAGASAGLRIYGQESHPPSSRDDVVAAHHNVMASVGLVVPVVFTDKDHLNGYYRIMDAESAMTNLANGAVLTATWTLELLRVGGSADVEIESQVITIARDTDHAVTPVFWHAPAGGAEDYFTGATVPASFVDRVASDGTVRVHLGIPDDVAPRWTVPAEDYLTGSARLLFDSIRRIGPDTPPGFDTWELTNGLVKVTGVDGGGGIAVSCWAGAEWQSEREFRFTSSAVAVTDPPVVSVVRNTPEVCVVRLSYPASPGRLTVDLGLRRGARFVTGTVKRHSAATLGVQPEPADTTGAQVTGGVLHAPDGDSNATFLGSPQAVTRDHAVTGGVSLAATLRLDFMTGHQVGNPPAAGDAYADLLAQYLGSTGERERVVRL